jgi:hypothetical protein
MRSFLVSAATLMLLAACGGPPQRHISDAEATTAAQAHVPFLLERIAARDRADTGFVLNVRVPREGTRAGAQLALTGIVKTGATLRGTVRTPDKDWPEFPVGTTMTFGPDIIEDWSFRHANKLVGAFRLRAKMCNVAGMLEGLKGKTPEAQAALDEAQGMLDPTRACEDYDPRSDVGAAK